MAEQHVHRCMRCGQAFYCLTPEACKAGAQVFPRVVMKGPDGDVVMFEHVCTNGSSTRTSAK